MTYSYEINLLSKLMGGLKDLSVLEIGSGIGGHASEISKHKPESLTLVDKDPIAFHTLSRRFRSNNKIEIFKSDGFTKKPSWDAKDRVICMYSLVQQATSYSEMLNRINRLSNTATRSGVVAFEMIDFKVSKKIYPSNKGTKIYEDEKGYMEISSIYKNDYFKITFDGKLQDIRCNYEVKLVAKNLKKLLLDLNNHIFTECFVHPLEKNSRRVIVIGHK